MAHTRRPQHPNAALTPVQRFKMVSLVAERGWSVAAASAYGPNAASDSANFVARWH